MHFYRSMNPVSAITFDLDDTLYDNSVFMAQTEAAMIEYLRQIEPLSDLQFAEFNHLKVAIIKELPDIYHDVLIWRAATLKKMLENRKFSTKDINKIVKETMDHFIFCRNDKIIVPDETHQILNRLSEKYPLAVISNGNVEISKVGMSHYFQFALRSGPDGRAKPFPEIYNKAAQQLSIPIENILHVGDNLQADVLGAVSSGMQACWLNIYQQDILQLSDARVLPHVEIAALAELNNLL